MTAAKFGAILLASMGLLLAAALVEHSLGSRVAIRFLIFVGLCSLALLVMAARLATTAGLP